MRSIHAVPGLKRLINSLFKSLALLANVVAFMGFFIIFFGIVGVSLVKGKEYSRCHYAEGHISFDDTNMTALKMNKTITWVIDD